MLTLFFLVGRMAKKLIQRSIRINKTRHSLSEEGKITFGNGKKGIGRKVVVFFVVMVMAMVLFSFTGRSEDEKAHVISDNNLFLEGIPVENGDRGYHLQEGIFLLAGKPTIPTEGRVLGAEKGSQNRDSIISYKVEEEDTVETIANKFDISQETIEWANSLPNGTVEEGDELLILPTTGVLHYVERGESLSGIANRHSAKVEDIVAFNDDVKDENSISNGQQIIIPDGERPADPTPQQAPEATHTGFAAVTHGTVTQGDHPGHANAVDIANNCGTPIYSGGSGTVTRTGNDPARAGNYIWIDYGNFEALYAHLQAIYVSSGQTVNTGEQIGTMGNTGYSTGCHIHFETRGGSNPFSHMQRGQTMQ